MTRTGQRYTTNAHGQVTEFRDQTHLARFDAQGHARFIQATHGRTTTSVTQGVGGQRTTQTKYADGSRVVNFGPHSGFAEKPIPGRMGFVSRTYSYGGTTRVSVYRSYSYRSHAYYRYVPAAYYHPAFYGWVNGYWATPIVYGWGAPPWGTYYGVYFAPFPRYATADLWLTDYLLYSTLQAAYAARQADAADQQVAMATAGQGQLDPQVKAMVAQQVQVDVSEMQTASGTTDGTSTTLPPPNAVPDVLKPDHTTFQVSTDVQLQYGQDQTCVVTAGDILFRKPENTVDAAGTVQVMVVGSKPGSCDLNTAAKIDLASLQEMDNQFEQQLESGMQTLAAKAGKGPFPASPAPDQTQVAAGTPPPAQNVDALLNQNQTSGDQAQAEVQSATVAGSA